MSVKKIRVLIVGVDGVPEVKTITPDLKTLIGVVGGYLQIIGPSSGLGSGVPGWHAYVNEEGKMYGQPFNPLANALAATAGWSGWAGGDHIVGPVIFLGNAGDDEGDVPEALVALCTGLVEELAKGGGDAQPE